MAESARLDELFKYFRSVSVALDLDHDIDLDAEFNASSVAQLNPNPVLNALAQLAACRLGCDRAFVSLIDNRNQYLMAEVTRSGSLYDANHHPDDKGIAFGVRALDLATGICASTIPPFTDPSGVRHIYTANIFADSTRYVVNDFSLEENYRDKPYVQGYPFFRFYAGVPIRTASGHVIGTFAVIHSAPRQGLDEEGYSILTEISSSIMRHFELLRIQSSHESALNLLHGLKNFVRNDTTFDSTNVDAVSSHLPKAQPERRIDHTIRQNGNLSPSDIELRSYEPTNDFDQSSSPLPNRNVDSQTRPSLYDKPEFKPVSYTKSKTPIVNSIDVAAKPASIVEDLSKRKIQPSVIQERYHDVLQRAACLVREALNMDVAVFLRAPSSVKLGTSCEVDDDAENGGGIRTSTRRPSVVGAKRGSRSEAGYLAPVTSEAAPNANYDISDALHARLLSSYPRGCFFNFTSYGSYSSSDVNSQESVPKALRSALPFARSMMYLPLFGPDGTCVRSLFVWSYEKPRILEKEDFSYLALFGATIEAKFAQIETALQSRAKSDFISSMSHELRSPLHGILGSAELLLNSNNIDAEQEEMIAMIEKCAGSLLTTLDHILTYSKINNRARDGLLESSVPNTNESPEMIDLSQVIEDSVDALTAGNHFRRLSTTSGGARGETENLVSQNVQISPKGLRKGPLVNLVIDSVPSWFVVTEAPVWARCLANVLGNALKYTMTGYIEVKLQMFPQAANSGPEQIKSMIKLTISDTGRGMSADYLRNHLYQPFLQEIATSDGLGLGLSIVKKLIDGIGGSVEIESTLGKGTTVEISVPLLVSSNFQNDIPDTTDLLYRGKKICFLGSANSEVGVSSMQSTFDSHQRTPTAVISAVSLYCEQWFNMEVSRLTGSNALSSCILFLFDEDLQLLQGDNSSNRLEDKKYPGCAFIIISTKYAVEKHPGWLKTDGVFYLAPPFGPRRLFSLVQRAFEYINRIKNDEIPSLDPSTLREVPTLESKKQELLPMRRKSVQPVKDEHDPTGKHVLVVDDNEVNVKLLTKCLTKWEVSHQTAFNGVEALEAFQNSEKQFDYILMDISMPVMNGLEATRAIRELEITQQRRYRAQIIAMTGLGDEKTRAEAVECGMDVFLTKPVRLREVKTLLSGGPV